MPISYEMRYQIAFEIHVFSLMRDHMAALFRTICFTIIYDFARDSFSGFSICMKCTLRPTMLRSLLPRPHLQLPLHLHLHPHLQREETQPITVREFRCPIDRWSRTPRPAGRPRREELAGRAPTRPPVRRMDCRLSRRSQAPCLSMTKASSTRCPSHKLRHRPWLRWERIWWSYYKFCNEQWMILA